MVSVEGRRRHRDARFLEYVIVGFAIVCFAAVGRQAYRWHQLRTEVEATKGRIETLRLEKERLEAEKEKLHTPEYVEKIAREEYNMVGKNEMPIFIVGEEKKEGRESK